MLVLALTGSIIAFGGDLQRMLAPEQYLAGPPPAGRLPLDWLVLHEIAERTSGGIATTLPLHRRADETIAFSVVAAEGGAPLRFDTIGLDPYTGKEIYRARIGDLRDGKAQIIPFIEALHFKLALGDWGAWLLGVAALAWALDCFVGLFLTLPFGSKPFWRQWRRAWKVKVPVPSKFRLHFDLHRASGLWLWPMAFVFAWSGVAFNLPAVYVPVMHVLTGASNADIEERPIHHGPPLLNWKTALALARQRAAEAALRRGITIERERELRFIARENVYALALRTSRDKGDDTANSWVTIDGDTGALLEVQVPTGDRPGDTIGYWLGLLHEAAVFGMPYRIFVSVTGLLITVLTITGVLVWIRKRRTRRTSLRPILPPTAISLQ